MAFSSNSTVVARFAAGLYGLAIGNPTMNEALASANAPAGINGLLNSVYLADFGGMATADVAALMVANVGITGTAADSAKNYVLGKLNAVAATERGSVVATILNDYAAIPASDAVYGKFAADWNIGVNGSLTYSQAVANTANIPVIVFSPELDIQTKTIAATNATAEIARIIGNTDLRIDFSVRDQQVKGVDLDRDGVIETNGVENVASATAQDDGHNFMVVDAYARDKSNWFNLDKNFLGDINFDGTGFGGDGKTTDGNIYLGGLGGDNAFGGIGNDFMTSGGVANIPGAGIGSNNVVAESLSGGRNADFFFVELSTLDATDGNGLRIDGGNTADNTSAGASLASGLGSTQDSDWILFEGSDDEEPYTINLVEGAGTINSRSVAVGTGTAAAAIVEIENFDASGNLYGFLDKIDVSLGGKTAAYVAGAANNGIGSTAQLVVNGSDASNIIIGGYDNDTISGDVNGGGNGSDDLLMGGNINFLINPNLTGSGAGDAIVDDGMDFITGNKGSDHIVFEADGGRIEGGNTVNAIENDAAALTSGLSAFAAFNDTGAVSATAPVAAENDTLWVTANALGKQTAAALISDARLRFDLNAQNIDAAAGYGGADVGSTDNTANDTQDQTKYNDSAKRVTVQDMESVILTGMGAVDYDTDGAGNTGDNAHTVQMNFKGYVGDIDLRGTAGNNTLYAFGGLDSANNIVGNDTIEGRQGRDNLSGGIGSDDFVFNLVDGQAVNGGDGVDVIHRQKDVGNNITDGTFVQDFGDVGTVVSANSTLKLTLVDTANPASELTNIPISGLQFKLGGVTYTVDTGYAPTYAGFKALLDTALKANDALKALTTTLNADNTITITDPAGGEFAKGAWKWVDGLTPADGSLKYQQDVGAPSTSQTLDRLIYQAYEDRADGEKVDDDSTTGSTISLGVDAYAQDLVVDVTAAGTRIAEDQLYSIEFANLTTQDKVKIEVNGVKYELTVGVNLDGSAIANEDSSTGTTQVNIQANFLTRMAAYINSFMDNDTAAGQVNAVAQSSAVLNATRAVNLDGGANDINSITINQVTYNGEETVFMKSPVVTILGTGHNGSLGEAPWSRVVNNAQHEVNLLGYVASDLNGTLTNRNGDFGSNNVLFLGDSVDSSGKAINQAILDTATSAGETLTGSEADVIDGGVDDLADASRATGDVVAFDNTATNANLALNFSVHGDDLLIGGSGADTINAGTGDDRVLGSMGTDTIDGGRNYYAVQVLGETGARVMVLNQNYESILANAANVAALKAITDSGKTITSITLINQTQSGTATQSGVFNDTLQFQQNDFTEGKTNFTVVLDNYNFNATTNTIELRSGGAGKVLVDRDGNGTTDATTTFTNFENVRTVSGTGNAVAKDGQGNDTLDVSAMSTSAAGISYDLTNRAVAAPTSTAGDVRYSSNAHASLTNPTEADFETLVMKVDGVENVTTGTGDDLLMIDETEAAKNNTFKAGLGDDRIDYLNDFALTAAAITAAQAAATALVSASGAVNAAKAAYAAPAGATVANADALMAAVVANGSLSNELVVANQAIAALVASEAAEPTVTIKVGAIGSEVDHVLMTGGRLGLVEADDTLENVERISLNGNTAESTVEADLIDIQALTGGAIVDYATGQIRTAGSVVNTNVQVTIDNIVEMERVIADGDDTVIVADAAVMNLNASSDELNAGSLPQDIQFATWYDYDQANTANTARLAFSQQTTAQIIDVINQYQFQFNLGEPGTDTVDYYNELGTITAVVNFTAGDLTDRVVVDGDSDAVLGDAQSRVDLLTDVESIVAAQGNSIIDLTNSTKNVKVDYSAGYTEALGLNTATDTETRTVVLSEYLGTAVGGALGGLNLIERIDHNTNATVPAFANATWDTVQGGDMGERVYLTAAEARDAHTLVLRGGDNLVSYQGMGQNTVVAATVGIAAATTGNLFSGLVTATVVTQDADPSTANTTDTITSYTQDNKAKAGTLELWGGGYGTDTLSFAGGTSDKYYQMGVLRNGSSWTDMWSTSDRSVPASISLTAFEQFSDDGATNDVYDMANIANVRNGFLNGFVDAAGNDHDTIKVAADAINFNLSGANTVDLDNLSAVAPGGFNFDFDVLDASALNTAGLILNGGTNVAPVTADLDTDDEVVVGALSTIASINDFEAVVLTQTSVAAGNSFVLDINNNRLIQGSTTVAMNQNTNTLSAGGLALGGELGNSYLPAVTTAVNLSVSGTNVENVTLVGGDGSDTLTGAAGNDTLVGGKGNDAMDGSFVAAKGAIYRVNIPGVATTSGAAGATVTVGGLTLSTSAAPTLVTEIAAGADADAIGAKFASQTLVAWKAALATAGLTAAQAAELQSVTYDAANNNLDFTFSTSTAASLVAAALITNPANNGAGGVVFAATEQDFQLYTARVDSADTFVFGKTAADNGVDTILNLDGSDTLNFGNFIAGLTSATITKVTTINDTTATNASDKLMVINNNGGTDLSATSLAEQFLSSTAARSFNLNDITGAPVGTETKDTAVVWEAGNAGTSGSLWYIEATDLDKDSVTDAGEVVATKVATLSNFNGVFFAATGAADTLLGTSGNDVFTGTGATITAADTITGGAGTDTLSISEVSVGGWAAGVTGVEIINMRSANGIADGLNTADTLVAAGGTVTFNLSGAGVGDTFTINGAAELDGTFVMNGSAQADTLIGGALADTFTGGSGADTITGNGGNDIINVGADADNAADVVVINSALAASADTINGFAVGEDDLHFSVAGLGLNAGDYAAGATTVVNAAGAAALAAAAWNNHVVVDTAANILALTIGAGSAVGGVLAVASDTGAVYFDANGAFATGAVIIGTVTGGGAFTAADLVMIA